MKKIIIEFWHGKKPLWQAFWLLFVFGHFLLIPLGIFTVWVFIEGPFYGIFPKEISVLPSGIVLFSFVLYASMSVWRCAKNTKMSAWTWLSRIIIILYLIQQAYGVYEVWTYWVPRLQTGL